MSAAGLDAADQLAIAELAVRYGLAFDVGDGAAWAALFAPDGRFVRPNGSIVEGTQALAAVPPASIAAVPGMRHLPGPVALEATGDGDVVRGRSYGQAVRLVEGPALALVVAGEYADTYVRTADGWRFRERRFSAWTPAPAPA